MTGCTPKTARVVFDVCSLANNAADMEIKMIYIFSALYCEAQSFIQYFRLTKEQDFGVPFQVFSNEEAEICLTVTGVGSIAAAVAVSSVCTQKKAGRNDFLLNIGVCAGAGGPAKPGRACLVSKITEQVTGRTFYPDILYRHPFWEAALQTGARLYEREPAAVQAALTAADGAEYEPLRLYDMEAAGIYQAGAYFFGPHRMIFIKIVSDLGAPAQLSPAQVTALIETKTEELGAYLFRLQDAGRAEVHLGIKQDEKQEQEAVISQLCTDLHCSQVMGAAVRQVIKYAQLSGIPYRAVLAEFYSSGRLPCRDKREGKQRLEELKRRLL